VHFPRACKMRVQGSVFRDFGRVARSKELKSSLFLHSGGIAYRLPRPAKELSSKGTEFHIVFG